MATSTSSLLKNPPQRRDSGERRRAYDECYRRDGHGMPQAAHAPHIGLFVQPVHHAARAQEEHRLGYAVRD